MIILSVLRGEGGLCNRCYRWGRICWPIQTNWGRSLLGAQIGVHKDAAAKKGAVVLDIPGDLAASGQEISTTLGTEGKRARGQAVMLEVPEISTGKKTDKGEGRRRGH